MSTKISIETGGTSFVDPSLSLQFILDNFSHLVQAYGYYSAVKAALDLFYRFPSVEYALGFDGVDDHIQVSDLEVGNNGLEIESEVWISRENENACIFTVVDNQERPIFTLTCEENETQVKAYYSGEDSVQEAVVQNLKLEEWHDLRIWTDGQMWSIHVDEKQVSSGRIECENSPFKLYFGRGQSFRHLKGMIRKIQVSSAANEVFSIQAGKNADIQDKTDSAVISGIHNIKKGRLEQKFN